MVDRVAPALLREVARLGARDLVIQPGGKHPRLIGRIGDAAFCHVFPLTASDWRSERNSISQLRRTLRALALATDATAAGPKPQDRKTSSRCTAPRPPAARMPARPAPAESDPWQGPLAELSADMARASQPCEAAPAAPEPVSSHPTTTIRDSPARDIALRTPWLGRRTRYQHA